MVNAIESIQLLEAGGKDAYDARSRETTLISHVYGGYVRQQTTCCACGAHRCGPGVGLGGCGPHGRRPPRLGRRARALAFGVGHCHASATSSKSGPL